MSVRGRIQRLFRKQQTLPFEMFLRPKGSEAADKKLERLYHKGQAKAWNGKEVLANLIEKHGGIEIDDDKKIALREVFAVILWGELAAWKISADLAEKLEPLEAKLAATAQTHDEARHFYVMKDYLSFLDEVPTTLGPKTTRVFLGTLNANTLTKKLMGMQLMIEPMALALFSTIRKSKVEPVLADLLAFYERDEARHVALGVLALPQLIRGLTKTQALDLWAWEFREFWHQLEMLKELEPHFKTLGIDIRVIADVGRSKQLKANKLLMEELGYKPAMIKGLVRFFDAKIAWDFPEEGPSRLQQVLTAIGRGLTGEMELTELAT